jgi:hypothetical protein
MDFRISWASNHYKHNKIIPINSIRDFDWCMNCHIWGKMSYEGTLYKKISIFLINEYLLSKIKYLSYEI